MFTGLVQQIGSLAAIRGGSGGSVVSVSCAPWRDGPLVPGESVAVQGVCLTVTRVRPDGFDADVLDETLRASALGELAPGEPLNLERALRPCDRLGGHVVQGHVDGTAVLEEVRRAGRDHVLRLRCPDEVARFVVYKGSVALDGTSLTVSAIPEPGAFEVDVIPTTWRETSLSSRATGDRINVETDVLGRYVFSFLSRIGAPAGAAAAPPPITMDLLARAGFAIDR
ncbi:MAG: riboflavin synthase [Kiritimatiellae bacterium]|nr:riboflavin synthase [Kiritimatiellia bacterium]